MERVRACVVGATGYAGVEVCRLVLGHPALELAMATDRKQAGERLDAVYPAFAGCSDLTLSLPEPDAIAEAADVAFLAVPHTASLALTPELLARGVTVIDLSADYRLHDPATYEAWYAAPHTSPELLSQTVYGLPELFRDGMAELAARRAAGEAVLVAVPGCYPTATALAARPRTRGGPRDRRPRDRGRHLGRLRRRPRPAPRAPTSATPNESVEAYGVAKHRHTPEIEQTLSEVAGREMSVVFTPHLAPLHAGTPLHGLPRGGGRRDRRGRPGRLRARLCGRSAEVTTLPAGQMPATASVAATARAQVGVALDARRRRTIVASCAIDNLGKGAAAQALQCANVGARPPRDHGASRPGAPHLTSLSRRRP